VVFAHLADASASFKHLQTSLESIVHGP
jgi:hypothetical protein